MAVRILVGRLILGRLLLGLSEPIPECDPELGGEVRVLDAGGRVYAELAARGRVSRRPVMGREPGDID